MAQTGQKPSADKGVKAKTPKGKEGKVIKKKKDGKYFKPGAGHVLFKKKLSRGRQDPLKHVRKVVNRKKSAASQPQKKKIGGEKNGRHRLVPKTRTPRFYPTEERPKKLKSRKTAFSKHRRYLRKSITPGTVLILLAGRHKGKRVVFLKQLNSGLLLVTGPFALNKCPLRRVNQIYVIATKTKVDLRHVTVPKVLTDDFFKRQKLKRPKHTEGEIFDTEKEKYSVSDERKKAQLTVDKQLLAAIGKDRQKKLLLGYLKSLFSLQKKQYPHNLVF